MKPLDNATAIAVTVLATHHAAASATIMATEAVAGKVMGV